MRCQSEYLALSAEHTTRDSYFDTPFGQAIRRAAFANALSILLEWGLAPSNSPAAAAFCYRARSSHIRKFFESALPQGRDGDTSGRNSTERRQCARRGCE